MAIVLTCLNILLIFVTWSFILVFKFFIDGLCVVDLVFATKTMSGAMVDPLVVMLLMFCSFPYQRFMQQIYLYIM